MQWLKSVKDEAEEYAHSKELGGGAIGHLLGYPLSMYNNVVTWPLTRAFGFDPYSEHASINEARHVTEKPLRGMPPKNQPKNNRPNPRRRAQLFRAMGRPGRGRGGRFRGGRVGIRGYSTPASYDNPPQTRRKGFVPESTKVQMEAPVSTGVVRNAGMTMKFGSGRRPGCMTIKGSMFVGLVGTGKSTLSNGSMFQTALGNFANNWMAMVQNKEYFSSPVSTFSSVFQRFRIRTYLEYRTRVNTSVSGNVKIVFLQDPYSFWSMTGKGSSSFSTPTAFIDSAAAQVAESDVAGYPDVTEGPVWANWRTPISHMAPGQDMNYTTAESYQRYISVGASAPAEVRQSSPGMYIFTTSGVSAPTVVDTFTEVGEIWTHYELELCDVITSPVQVVDPLTGGPGGKFGTPTIKSLVQQALKDLSLDGDKPEEQKSRSGSRPRKSGL